MAFVGNVTLEQFVLFLAVVIGTVVGANIFAAYLRKYFKMRAWESEFFVLLPRLVIYSVYAAGFYYGVYKVIRFDVTAFAAAFGIIGLAIAFSAQQTLQNIIAGIILFVDHSVVEGDYIDFGGALSKVVEVSVRKTKLRTVDGRVMFVPNAQLVTGSITNYSKGKFYRISITVPLAADADIERAQRIIYEIAVRNEDVIPKLQLKKKPLIKAILEIPPNIKKMEPKIWVRDISKERVVLECWLWITNFRAKERVISEMLTDTRREFKTTGIELG